MDRKGKVGSRIKFTYACCEKGKRKEGKIVGFAKGFPLIFVPECTCTSGYSTPACPVSVQCSWGTIEILLRKNKQLLFSFME